MRWRRGGVAAMVGVCLGAVLPASAHRADLMRPGAAGPIIRTETTRDELREWFGPPDSSEVIRVACVRVRKMKWGSDLKVYLNRDLGTAEAIFVRSRTIRSELHGEVTVHTEKGLRIGDLERRLLRKHPNADPITHAGHTHYRLKTGAWGSYLMAKVVDGEIVQLEAWPYEFC